MITTMLLLASTAITPSATSASAPATLDEWVSDVNALLQRHVVTPRSDGRGLATVRFRRDEDGRPVDVTVTSGSPMVTRAALATIRSIKFLPPMPATMPRNQRITFKLLVGDESHLDEYELERVAMLRSAKQSNTALAARLGPASQLADLTPR